MILPEGISEWKIVDQIKNGKIIFQVGDRVCLIRRKNNGYPRSVKDEDEYFIRKIDRDFLIIAKHSTDGIGWLQPLRIHKTYFLSINYLRDIKLKELLNSD